MMSPTRKPSAFPALVALIALLSAGISLAPCAGAAAGDCGQPKSAGDTPTASDALEVLKTAVGSSSCGGRDSCICDVDSSTSVTATDALRVLRKAVGQSVTLTCPCVVARTTELTVLTKAKGSYSTADMKGTWNIETLVSGPSSPWWSRGTLTIQSNGDMAGSLTMNDGSTENISAKLALASNGTMTCTQNCQPNFQGALDSDKTVGGITATEDDGSTQLLAVTKRAGSYAQSDLGGIWAMHSLVTGPRAPAWTRGTLTIGSNGSFTASFQNSDGSPSGGSGTLTLSGTGQITCTGSDCPGDFGGALDSGKTVGAVTATEGDGSTQLILVCKQAASYSQSDLTGSWNLNSLASGPDEPWWNRGTLTVAADGSLTGSLTDSNGAPQTVSGSSLSITAGGIITISDDPDARCEMDSGKTVVVCTTTWQP